MLGSEQFWAGRSWGRRVIAAVLAGILFVAGPAGAQTAEQLQRLEDLSPAQKEAVREALNGSEAVRQQELSQPPLVTPRETTEPATPDIAPQTRYPTLGDLEPFGYSLFAGQPTTFAPATDIPVPVDYIVGPGDTIELQYFGNQSAYHSLVVGRDGVLNVPDIGPVTVSGLEFGALSEMLKQRVETQMIGVSLSVTMGPLRSIRVFVLGEAYRPGSYTVSALSTMTNALFVSGGISRIGSLRNIQLKRNGRTITRLDLYDLLLGGDTSGDRRLQPGDVIFVPPIGQRVGVGGEVKRPAVYELASEKTVGEILELAGGMLPSAYPEASQVSRISPDRERTIVDIDLSRPRGLAAPVAPDDLLTVFSVLDKREDIVVLQGHVYRPGPQQWTPGMRVTNLVASSKDVRPNAFLDYVMIRREDPGSHEVSVLSANLGDALRDPGSSANVELRPLDQVTVFAKSDDRRSYVDPVLADLRLQARSGRPSPEVRISGRVRAPGTYPLEQGMRVTDLLRAGGHILESGYAVEAELTRQVVGPDQQRDTRLITVDLAAALRGSTEADILLQSRDFLNVREIPEWRDLETVSLEGEVRFAGQYPIRRGERLSSLLQRAGGLTEESFPGGALFLREELRERERQQITELVDRLESELDAASLAADGGSAAETAVKSRVLEQVRQTQATGRLVIDLPSIVAGTADASIDVILRGGDRLLVPRETQTVTIIGEVQFPTSYVYEPGVSRDDYVNRSGGITAQADKKRIYVVRADGSVVASNSSLFFRNRDYADIRAGDTIVVPIKPDPISTLGLWTSVTTVIYNIGVAAAAVASF